MKKALTIILCTVIFYSCSKVNKKYNKNEKSNKSNLAFKVSEVQLKDTVILNYVRKYLDDFSTGLDESGIAVIKYTDSKKGSNYYISHIIPYESIIRKYPPLGFMTLDNQYLLVYSGIESNLFINDTSMDILLNKLKKYLIKDNANDDFFVTKNYDAPILKVSINYDTIFSEQVEQNPY